MKGQLTNVLKIQSTGKAFAALKSDGTVAPWLVFFLFFEGFLKYVDIMYDLYVIYKNLYIYIHLYNNIHDFFSFWMRDTILVWKNRIGWGECEQ